MPHQNSVMHAVTQHLPWDDFDRLVAALKADAVARGFNSKSHLMAMLFAQLSGAEALRDVEAGMASHADRLYHLGVTPAVRSTLADANRNRDSRLFSELFARMIGASIADSGALSPRRHTCSMQPRSRCRRMPRVGRASPPRPVA